jgi:hypothetical protein
MNLIKTGLCLICLAMLSLAGCSSSYDEISTYKKAGINEDIPVPATAESSKVQFDNPNIKKGERYNLENIGGEQGLYHPIEYFEEIKSWGWEVLEKEQMGHVHFFRKGDTIISIEIKEDYFHLYEMKEGFEFSH